MGTPELRLRGLILNCLWIGGLCSISGVAAFAQPEPSIGPRKVVAEGPQYTAIHEVGAALDPDASRGIKVVAVWTVENPAYFLQYAVSNDGGKNWTTANLTSTGATQSAADTTVAVATDGTFMATYFSEGSQPAPEDGLYMNIMPPTAPGFGTPTQIHTTPYDFPQLVFGEQAGEGYFCLTTFDGTPGTSPLLFGMASKVGGSWTWGDISEVQMDDADVLGFVAKPAVNAYGDLYMAYIHAEPQGPDYDYSYRALRWTGSQYDFVRPGQDPTWLDEQFHPPANDQFYFNSYVPGEFRIPCIAELAAHPTDPNRLYLVFCDRYADEIGQPGSEDGDMDIYVMRSTDGGETWSPRVRVNQDRLYDPGDPDWDDHVLYDQFMPQIAVDASDRVHVIWYDTRLDHLAANDPGDFRIEMYYAWAFDNGEDPLEFTETSLDVAIKTENLTNPRFIGDYNALLTTGNRVLPLYMGTQHLQSIPGDGQRGPTQRDEAILVNRIFW